MISTPITCVKQEDTHSKSWSKALLIEEKYQDKGLKNNCHDSWALTIGKDSSFH